MSRPLLHTLRCAILAGLAGLVLGVSAQERFDAQVDTLLRLGHDRPDVAMAALRSLEPPADDRGAQRLLLLARGIVLAAMPRPKAGLARCARMRAAIATARPKRRPSW
jgi:hypothetical protein